MRYLALLLLASCGYTQIQQSSLVPVAAMPPPIAQRGRIDVYAGDNVVTYLGTRELRENEDAGLYLPRHQLDGSITARLSRFMGIRLQGGVGLADDATAAAPTAVPSPDRAVPWAGIGTYFNYLDPSGFGLDAEFDTLVAFVPSTLRSRECFGDSCGDWSEWHYASDTVPMLAGTIRGHYTASEWFTIYAGLTVRNHPTNDAAFNDLTENSSVRMGDPTLVVGLGAEFTVEDVFSIIPQITWPVWGGPVEYGPMFGIALRGHFAEGPGDELAPWSHVEELPIELPLGKPVPEEPPAIEQARPEPSLYETPSRPLWMQ